MDLASAEAEIRHVFGDTPITEASIGAAPPGNNIAQWYGHARKYANEPGELEESLQEQRQSERPSLETEI